MKTTVGRICDAMNALTMIGNRSTMAIPNKGRYAIARLRTKLQSEFETIQKTRDAMIEKIGVAQMANPGEGQPPVPTGNFIIPPEKSREWDLAWKEFASTEIEIEVNPIKTEQLQADENSSTGGLEAGELMLLGEFIDNGD